MLSKRFAQAVQQVRMRGVVPAALLCAMAAALLLPAMPAQAQTLPQSRNTAAPTAPAPSAASRPGFVTIDLLAWDTDPEYLLAKTAYDKVLKSLPGAKLHAGKADLNGDGEAEVFVKIDHPKTCDATGCMTAILHKQGNEIREIFLQQALTVDIAQQPGLDGWRQLLVNNYIRWDHAAQGYRAALDDLGTQVEWIDTNEGPAYDAALNALGQTRLDNALAADGQLPRVQAAYADLNGDGDDEILIHVQHSYLCNDTIGCFIFVLARDNMGRYRTLAEWSTFNGVLLLSERRTDGMRDFILTGQPGFVAMQWNESERTYTVGQRSFHAISLSTN